MATLEAPHSNGNADPTSPVPLDTIPISPANDDSGSIGDMGDEDKPPGDTKSKEYNSTDQITVFHDPDNFNVKHPLMHQWTLWFTKPPSGKVYSPEL